MGDQRDNVPEPTIRGIDVTGERMLLGAYPGFVEREHLERYRYAEQFVAGKDVLDVACGTGYGSAILARAGARSVTGLDVSPEAVQFADQNYASATVRFLHGDAQQPRYHRRWIIRCRRLV
jgi:2-polyprenyl-3-methyl-5-hydroxy-6-metoxy-1,4-benzoquinol methylase